MSQLIAQIFQMRVRMKNLMGIMEGGSLPTMSNLEEAMKAEQKVIMFCLLYLRLFCYICLFLWEFTEYL